MRAGANKDLQDCCSMTALMYAAKKGRIEIVQVLLEAAADQNLEDNRGLPVFQLAAEHVAIVQMLARAKKRSLTLRSSIHIKSVFLM